MSTFLIRNENGSNSNIDPFCIYKIINFLLIRYNSYIAIFVSLIFLLLFNITQLLLPILREANSYRHIVCQINLSQKVQKYFNCENSNLLNSIILC